MKIQDSEQAAARRHFDLVQARIATITDKRDGMMDELIGLDEELVPLIELAASIRLAYDFTDAAARAPNGKLSLPQAIDGVLAAAEEPLFPKDIAARMQEQYKGRLGAKPDPAAISAALGRCHVQYGWTAHAYKSGSWKQWTKGGAA